MKAIALLTTLFLPGTFVATFFSMGMFDWDLASSNDLASFNSSVTSYGSTSPKVSRYLWVYWAVTIPLTLVVMVVLLIWARWDDWKEVEELGTSARTRTGDSKVIKKRTG